MGVRARARVEPVPGHVGARRVDRVQAVHPVVRVADDRGHGPRRARRGLAPARARHDVAVRPARPARARHAAADRDHDRGPHGHGDPGHLERHAEAPDRHARSHGALPARHRAGRARRRPRAVGPVRPRAPRRRLRAHRRRARDDRDRRVRLACRAEPDPGDLGRAAARGPRDRQAPGPRLDPCARLARRVPAEREAGLAASRHHPHHDRYRARRSHAALRRLGRDAALARARRPWRRVRLGIRAEQRDAPLDPVDGDRPRTEPRPRPCRRLGTARRSAPRRRRRAPAGRRLRHRGLCLLLRVLGSGLPHRPAARPPAPRDRAERHEAREAGARMARGAREDGRRQAAVPVDAHPRAAQLAAGLPAASTTARSPPPTR